MPIDFAGLRGESIELPDDSCDSALCTFTLCTIPGVEQALLELRRVLKPGGRFHFLEHGLAPDDGVQRGSTASSRCSSPWPTAATSPVTRRSSSRDAGFEIESVESAYAQGPKPWVYMTVGRAVNPA